MYRIFFIRSFVIENLNLYTFIFFLKQLLNKFKHLQAILKIIFFYCN